jgi:hypothetical protein
MWNIHGVISPVSDGEEGHSPDRSPYHTNILEFAKKFAFSVERVEILLGLLEYRKTLYLLDINTGFQWVNGSFVENVESIRQRPPNDVDVVTFSNLCNTIPNYSDFVTENLSIFDSSKAKQKYKVDAYWVDMDTGFNEYSVERCTYWYSMWSHQRDTNIWKGFYVIPLSPEKDIEAIEYLSRLKAELDHA